MLSVAPSANEIGILKQEFLASIDHEMRTPLSGILGMVDLLLETELSGEQREYLDATRQCAESLLEIMSSTLEFSALSAHQVVLEESEFPLLSILNDALDEFTVKARAKGLGLILSFAPNLPEIVIGDALRLRQLLAQVAGNAVKFTHRGQVEVSAGATTLGDGNLLLDIVVRDTGIGIPQDKLSEIFAPFLQLESGLSRRYTGMGLGLALTQKLVGLMQGRVSVRSQVGTGTEFSITIPLRLSRERGSAEPAPAPGALNGTLRSRGNKS